MSIFQCESNIYVLFVFSAIRRLASTQLLFQVRIIFLCESYICVLFVFSANRRLASTELLFEVPSLRLIFKTPRHHVWSTWTSGRTHSEPEVQSNSWSGCVLKSAGTTRKSNWESVEKTMKTPTTQKIQLQKLDFGPTWAPFKSHTRSWCAVKPKVYMCASVCQNVRATS